MRPYAFYETNRNRAMSPLQPSPRRDRPAIERPPISDPSARDGPSGRPPRSDPDASRAPEPAPFLPRSVGSSAPAGQKVYEFFVRIHSRVSVGGRLLALFAERNVDVLGLFGQTEEDRLTAGLVIYADFGAAPEDPFALAELLRRQEFVIEVRVASKERMFLEEMTFPPTGDGQYRVLIFPTEWWSSLVRGLVDQYGSAAGSILHEQGVNAGRTQVGHATSRVQAVDRALLVELLRTVGRTSGWGLFEIEEDPTEVRERFRIAIRGGPWPANEPFPVEGCQFVVGFLRGALQVISETALVVRDLTYDQGTLRFELVGTRGIPPSR